MHNILKDNIGKIELIEKPNISVPLKVVNAARTSYKNESQEFSEKDKKLTAYLWNNGHTSPFRHSFYTFMVKAPLFVFRQWTKYQVGSTWRKYEVDGEAVSLEIFDLFYDTDKGCSWNEVSGRYARLTPEFYVPDKMRSNSSHGSKQSSKALPPDFNHSKWKLKLMEECEQAYKSYEEKIESGIAKEIARINLPQSIYTSAYWTVSLQGVLHFLSQRLHKDAQYEIQQYALAVYSEIKSDLDILGITKESLTDE